MFRIRQIYFNKSQRSFLDSQFIPYFNENATKYLENKVISDLVNAGDCTEKYYGVFSHHFRLKTGRAASQVFHWIEKDNYSHDVYCFKASFTPTNIVNIFTQGDRWHPLFSKIAVELFDKLGVENILDLKMPPIFYNYWVARSEIVESFVNDLLDPAMKELESIEMAYEDSEYRISKERSVDISLLMKIFGKPYYTYHPFICERLFPTYVTLNNLTYKFI